MDTTVTDTELLLDTTVTDTELLLDTTITFCTVSVPLNFCVCNTLHTILTSANDTSDRELPCVCTVVNDLELTSRTLRIDFVSLFMLFITII